MQVLDKIKKAKTALDKARSLWIAESPKAASELTVAEIACREASAIVIEATKDQPKRR